MNELALFAGIGGGILGSTLRGHKVICAVESDAYCRKVLMSRQDDGSLPPFPIWDDVRTFDGKEWQGRVDVVSGGFPCQPFSKASRNPASAEDLWPEMLRVVEEVEPRFVFAENVAEEPIITAARTLGARGWECHIFRADAGAYGAPHRRPRWWVVADADPESKPRRPIDAEACFVHSLARSKRWWGTAQHLGVDDGDAHRVDRVGALGNAQVPAVVSHLLGMMEC